MKVQSAEAVQRRKFFLKIQSYPGYPNTFGQRGFIGCSDKPNCSDNPSETFLAIYILYNIKSMYEGRA